MVINYEFSWIINGYQSYFIIKEVGEVKSEGWGRAEILQKGRCWKTEGLGNLINIAIERKGKGEIRFATAKVNRLVLRGKYG